MDTWCINHYIYRDNYNTAYLKKAYTAFDIF
jgi:hypothetical protein